MKAFYVHLNHFRVNLGVLHSRLLGGFRATPSFDAPEFRLKEVKDK